MKDQLKVEKASSYAKDTRIKSLEELVIEVGYDPSKTKVAEELVKKKNVDIATLRKQLKLPPTEHPQAKEKDKLVQEKEASKTQNVPPTIIPMVTTAVPSTLV